MTSWWCLLLLDNHILWTFYSIFTYFFFLHLELSSFIYRGFTSWILGKIIKIISRFSWSVLFPLNTCIFSFSSPRSSFPTLEIKVSVENTWVSRRRALKKTECNVCWVPGQCHNLIFFWGGEGAGGATPYETDNPCQPSVTMDKTVCFALGRKHNCPK